MSEIEPTERIGEKTKKKVETLEARIAELERVMKAVLVGMANAENEIGEPVMPEGNFYGRNFSEE